MQFESSVLYARIYLPILKSEKDKNTAEEKKLQKQSRSHCGCPKPDSGNTSDGNINWGLSSEF